jgi:hypothetical protein
LVGLVDKVISMGLVLEVSGSLYSVVRLVGGIYMVEGMNLISERPGTAAVKFDTIVCWGAIFKLVC